MSSDFIEVVHQYQTVAVTVAAGVNLRIKLGLSSKEIAEIKAISFMYSVINNTGILYTVALSKDPDEQDNIDSSSVQRQSNIIALYSWRELTLTSGALDRAQSPLITLPDPGIAVASDISVMAGVSADLAAARWGCTVYFTRRNERRNEREMLIMARR